MVVVGGGGEEVAPIQLFLPVYDGYSAMHDMGFNSLRIQFSF